MLYLSPRHEPLYLELKPLYPDPCYSSLQSKLEKYGITLVGTVFRLDLTFLLFGREIEEIVSFFRKVHSIINRYKLGFQAEILTFNKIKEGVEYMSLILILSAEEITLVQVKEELDPRIGEETYNILTLGLDDGSINIDGFVYLP